ncbi:MAG: iron-containing alcohol dehydrogenase [Egibacteraceae bacterium]
MERAPREKLADASAGAEARQDMALVSLFGGLALANAGLGAVHGFAGPLGGAIGAPHGVICGRLLPFVVETNVAALSHRAPGHPALARYAEVARLLTGDPDASVDDGVAWLAELGRTLDVPGLAAYGLEEGETAAHVTAAKRASSMRGNPVELTDDELAELLRRAA